MRLGIGVSPRSRSSTRKIRISRRRIAPPVTDGDQSRRSESNPGRARILSAKQRNFKKTRFSRRSGAPERGRTDRLTGCRVRNEKTAALSGFGSYLGRAPLKTLPSDASVQSTASVDSSFSAKENDSLFLGQEVARSDSNQVYGNRTVGSNPTHSDGSGKGSAG